VAVTKETDIWISRPVLSLVSYFHFDHNVPLLEDVVIWRGFARDIYFVHGAAASFTCSPTHVYHRNTICEFFIISAFPITNSSASIDRDRSWTCFYLSVLVFLQELQVYKVGRFRGSRDGNGQRPEQFVCKTYYLHLAVFSGI
jgi:hypothetical protein